MKLAWLTAFLGALAAGNMDAQEVRGAVAKSLSYLAKEGERWMAEKDCISCHHLPEMVWAHREAGVRGFNIDAARLEEWLVWADERADQKQHGLEQASLMLLAMPDRKAEVHVQRIVSEQLPDGAWKPGNQYVGMQQRGQLDAASNAVRVHLLALQSPKVTPGVMDGVLAKAKPVLTNQVEVTSMESEVFRLQYALSTGAKDEAARLVTAVTRQQRGDGGWSSVIGVNMSDPLATGQVLWALHSLGDPKVKDVIARAEAWLVHTQKPDGSWPMDYTHISKIDRSAPARAKSAQQVTEIYAYWGTGWATIGLLQGLPLSRQITD